MDPELFRKIRRGGDLRTLVFNMAKVRAVSRRMRVAGPLWKWSVVVSDRIWAGLADLVDFALAQGVERFCLKNLVEYDDPPHGEPVHHIARLPAPEMRAARQAILDAGDAMARAGAECEIEAGILDAVDAVLAGGEHSVETSIADLPATRFAALPGARKTRECYDPWNYAFIHADQSVRPCCLMDRTFGSIAGGTRLEEVLDNEQFRALRQGLLTGDLDPTCARCPSRALIDVEEFRGKVEEKLLSC